MATTPWFPSQEQTTEPGKPWSAYVNTGPPTLPIAIARGVAPTPSAAITYGVPAATVTASSPSPTFRRSITYTPAPATATAESAAPTLRRSLTYIVPAVIAIASIPTPVMTLKKLMKPPPAIARAGIVNPIVRIAVNGVPSSQDSIFSELGEGGWLALSGPLLGVEDSLGWDIPENELASAGSGTGGWTRKLA